MLQFFDSRKKVERALKQFA
jgi:hypothetical protein